MSRRPVARVHLAAASVVLLLLAGCAEEEGRTENVELDATIDDPGLEGRDPSPTGPGLVAPDAEVEGPEGLVDGTEAVPGTWPIGDAGTVTFEVGDRGLVLVDVNATSAWTTDTMVELPDEIEVIFTRPGQRWRFEVELLAGRSEIEVEVDLDLADAAPGTYRLGDAGTFTFTVDEGWPVLTDVTVADGWQLSDRDQDGDEFTLTLSREGRRYDVEVEAAGARIELEIDHTILGPVP